MNTLARYWTKLDGKKVRCELCPHRCVLDDGQVGICRVRKNIRGKLYTLNYGAVSSMGIDPIEKKPLFHFKPASRIFSIATVGCNLRCKHCQNWEISQSSPEFPALRRFKPREIVRLAEEYGSEGIAFTYNEPIIWHEFTMDVAKEAKKRGMYTVYVSNGFINPEPLKEVLQYIDAFNIDVKAFTDDFYLRIAAGHLEPVLRSVELIHKAGRHIELTYLIIPGLNDSPQEIENFARWVHSVSPEIPVHLSRFYPTYKLTDRGDTPVSTMHRAYRIAKDVGLEYVYLGNTWEPEYESTYCPNCGELLIERIYYKTRVLGITKDATCKKCGRKINIVI